MSIPARVVRAGERVWVPALGGVVQRRAAEDSAQLTEAGPLYRLDDVREFAEAVMVAIKRRDRAARSRSA